MIISHRPAAFVKRSSDSPRRLMMLSALCAVSALSASCGSHDVALHDVRRGFYPPDSTFTVSATLVRWPSIHIPLTGMVVSSLADGPDTVLAVVADTEAPGPVRVHARGYDARLIGMGANHVVLRVTGPIQRRHPLLPE